MGLFFNRKEKQQKEQKLAELKQRREQLVAQFERGIASLKSVFAEAIEHGYGKSVIGKNRTIERMLWLDLTSIVLNIANEIGDRPFNNGGQTAAGYALSILRRVAPEELPELGTYQPKFANKHFDPAAQQWAEGVEYRLACEELLRDCGCEFISPGMLSVMQEYDRVHGTLHAHATAEMFIAFLLALEATPALKGARILGVYISALKEYMAKNPSQPSATSLTTLEAYETLEVHPDCTDEELNEAYHRKVNYWHPDKFHSTDIPAEMKDLATRKLARVNEAYHRVQKERQAAQPVGSEKRISRLTSVIECKGSLSTEWLVRKREEKKMGIQEAKDAYRQGQAKTERHWLYRLIMWFLRSVPTPNR